MGDSRRDRVLAEVREASARLERGDRRLERAGRLCNLAQATRWLEQQHPLADGQVREDLERALVELAAEAALWLEQLRQRARAPL